VISTTDSASFVTKTGEQLGKQLGEKDEGNEGEEQQQGQGYGQNSIVSSWLIESLANAFTPSCSDIRSLTSLTCLIKATILFELVLYPTDILSATIITAAVGSANPNTIPSKPLTRQPLQLFACNLFCCSFLVATLSAGLTPAGASSKA
jgi:hypothetical protein